MKLSNRLPPDLHPFPDRDEFSIFATLRPTREVAGDFFDYFVIGDGLYFCVGEVSGKGVPATRCMAMTRTLVRAYASDDRFPASALTRVNEELSRGNPNCIFVALLLGVLDIRSGMLRFTNAGHICPYRINHLGIEPLRGRTGPVLDAKGGVSYEEELCYLGIGDTLVAFTDSVTEARSADDELLRNARLEATLRQSATLAVRELVDRVTNLVAEFAAGTNAADDVTVLALRLHRLVGQGDHRQTIVLLNDLGKLSTVMDAIDDFCGRHQIDTAVNRRLKVVLDDLLANVIAYGFNDRQEHRIELTLELTDQDLKVQVSDDGVPFDLLAAERPDTTVALEERELGGLGIELIRSLSDELAYERLGNRNVVTLGLRLHRA